MKFCKYGHAKTPENTYLRKYRSGWVSHDCRTCRRWNEEKRIRDRTNVKRKRMDVNSKAAQVSKSRREAELDRRNELMRQLMIAKSERLIPMMFCE